MRLSDKCPQNFVQVVGQMSVSDKCPCRTNVRVGQMSVLDKCPVPNLFCPAFYINFDIQTNFEVNHTQIGHSIPKNNPTKFEPKIQKTRGFLAKIFVGGLNQR